ncbi:MAG: hypothetical protein V7668_18480 [Cereibacter changlensis]|uniref:Uncharacterized protein n=2 Tax=Cereibacter changlensis TaxID=402884 RepID=A0A2T4JKC9_9RHOB|nr:hypothetical protein [Cereibacter changlensis]PTE18371.1 hypothetical protein C5F48_23745 [Cereibacter changlensis JA139]PZX49300.1 hypothetical protein LX76_03935 [Cereibacter changlensis]
MSMKTYRAKAAGWIAGRRVAAGEEIRLTASQAKYEPVEPVVAETTKPSRKAKAAPAPEPDPA